MSKTLARGPESYADEERFFLQAVRSVEASGFSDVSQRKSGPVKIIEASSTTGDRVLFWVKLGWSKVPFAAIQFGMFAAPGGKAKTDDEFMQFVAGLADRMKAKKITHVLLVHRDALPMALAIDDLAAVYSEQVRKFPREARNTKSPTMWFFDPTTRTDPELTAIVRRRAIPLEILSRRANVNPLEPEVRSRMVEVEARVEQQRFRYRVGERYKWRCVITGSTITEILDAAHLPGRDWRRDNHATDGILVRADIHRLIDKGLAQIVDGKLQLSKNVMPEYGEYNGRVVG